MHFANHQAEAPHKRWQSSRYTGPILRDGLFHKQKKPIVADSSRKAVHANSGNFYLIGIIICHLFLPAATCEMCDVNCRATAAPAL